MFLRVLSSAAQSRKLRGATAGVSRISSSLESLMPSGTRIAPVSCRRECLFRFDSRGRVPANPLPLRADVCLALAGPSIYGGQGGRTPMVPRVSSGRYRRPAPGRAVTGSQGLHTAIQSWVDSPSKYGSVQLPCGG